ncbi:MAG: 4-hydroxybenzoate octaprenyltransferase [Candidatus Xiphinematobacter sp.]|nr:MAG: 4-hydroxybenzoate octaprenyltransferase [Candidatus Xiphinematobacter sp.]
MQKHSMGPLRAFLQFVCFSHTIFALPFALGSMLTAAHGFPSRGILLLIVVAMVCARTAAMTFNRVVDRELDKRNPRTACRHLLVSQPTAIAACAISSLAFIGTTWAINRLCLALSPLALGIVFFYSLTKRFTYASQFFLGLALSVAPIGAWNAVTGEFALPPLILALCVFLWAAGFDMVYAIQDVEVDRREGLKSMVVLLGVSTSIRTAQWLHVGMLLSLVLFGWVEQLGFPYAVALGLIACLLLLMYRLATDSSTKIAANWVLSNATMGLLLMAGIFMDFYWRSNSHFSSLVFQSVGAICIGSPGRTTLSA